MSFASEQLYKGYLRRNMPTIVTKVKVREILIHLPCLTAHDRETIEAKRETCGNYDGMVLLLDCLKRRENWPEQFIDALEACEHTKLAADIRKEYDTLRGANNPKPSSPPTTVVRAHVHPAPSAGHVSVPENAANSEAVVAPSSEAPAPPKPPAQPLPSLEVQPQAPQSAAAQPPQSTQAEVVPPPANPPLANPPLVNPPPCPETPHPSADATPPPQREVNAHQEPEENSESDLQDDESPVNDRESAGKSDVSAAPPEQCETAASSIMDRSPSPPLTNLDVTDGAPSLTNTSEKAPVQDTTPLVNRVPAVVLEPEETSEPPAAQVVESSPQTEIAATASTLPAAAFGNDASACDEDDVCLSKPGQLVSIQPQNHSGHIIPASSTVEVQQPYSGNSERLMMSSAVPSAHVPPCTAVVNTAPPCQENGIAHNEPEENHYESTSHSLGEVRVNVVRVAEEPSILNLDGQTAAPQPQIINGETAKEMSPVPPTITIMAAENHHPPEPASDPKTLQDSGEKTATRTLSTNTKYILTAAGVGACALLVAWRFKN